MIATKIDATLDYEKAYQLGKKEGGSPAVLDQLLKERHITAPAEVPLGCVSIPIDRIVGIKSAGRTSSFSKSFYPTLKEDTEFAHKWIALCNAHLNEGIREPVKAYEFMNQFYIEEGNKRVSVLKFFDAVSVPGNVTRIIPPQSDDKETRIYYEFMDFYSLSEINDIWFSRTGSFARLQRLVGKQPNELWTTDERKEFRSLYARFDAAFRTVNTKKLNVLPGDAFLYFINLYDYHALSQNTNAELKEKVKKLEAEFQLLKSEQSVSLQMQPDEKSGKVPLLQRLIPASMKKLKICFIHARTAQSSSWTYAHDLGRTHLDETFPDQVTTSCYDNATEENIASYLTDAIEAGNDLIFTTSPIFFKESVKAAVEHPEVKILNCSLNTSSRHIRTYHARMYEAKFLMGVIAGCLSENGHLGYIADYPIFGTISGINAFALGAKMVNPRAKVYLAWSKTLQPVSEAYFEENKVSIISGTDLVAPGVYNRQYGLYSRNGDSIWNIAFPLWNWGKFYEQMIRKAMNDSWKYDDEKDATKGLNYWWGMSSGIVEILCSHRLPIGTARLVDLLRNTMCRSDFNPFSGILFSQDGVVQKDPDGVLSPEDIIKMDWLAENVIGSIPAKQELREPARSLTSVQGSKEEDRLP